jgi:hypothetical protein
MLRLIASCGVMLWPMLVLAIVLLVLIVVSAFRLARGRCDLGARSSIDGILFWGVVTAILGFTGQWMGLNKVVQVLFEVAPRLGISPRAVGIGFAESLRTSIFGIAVLIVAGVSWFLLRAWWRRVAERGGNAMMSTG